MDEKNINNLPDNDDFIIGKGFEIGGNEPIPNKTKKKSSKGKNALKNIIWILVIIIVSIGLAFSIIFAGADYMGLGFGRGNEATMEIKMGTPAAEIAEQLKETGAVKMPILFRVYAKLMKYEGQFKYGVYTFNTEAGYEAIAEMLIKEGAKAETVKVTIPEGTGINDYTKNVNGEKVVVAGITTLLEKNGVCTRADFLDALDEIVRDSELLSGADDIRTYHTLEGYLFPETYDFYSFDSKECAKLAAKKMVNEAEKRITASMFNRASDLGYNMNEVLTIASIVQMESGNNVKDMPNVAAVFYNRLKSAETGGILGSSPTIYYGKSFKQDDGRYNTQGDNKFAAIKGLPPGPICSPGMDAINAALYPSEDFPYFYFVTDKSGNFYYRKTLAEHNKIVSQLKKGDNWIYEKFD